MSTAVPFKGAVCATLCKPTVQRADIIPYRSHDGVFCVFLLVAKAQISVLCYIEAMKTYNAIRADFDGTVVAICVNSGDSVSEDDVLMKIG